MTAAVKGLARDLAACFKPLSFTLPGIKNCRVLRIQSALLERGQQWKTLANQPTTIIATIITTTLTSLTSLI